MKERMHPAEAAAGADMPLGVRQLPRPFFPSPESLNFSLKIQECAAFSL